MKKILLPFVLFFCTLSYGQSIFQWRILQPIGGASVTGNTGFVATGGVATNFPSISWTTIGSLATCTVQVDYSTDGVTVAGQLITAQTCTSSGSIISGSSSVKPFTRVSYVIGTGGGFINFTALGCNNGTCTSGGGGGGGVTQINIGSGLQSTQSPLTTIGTISLLLTCSNNQVEQWNGSAWACATLGGSGTVTSVALTVPSWLIVGGSPITTTGTLAVTPAAAQTSHQVIGTCGSATTFTPCALVAGDIPTGIPIANIGSGGLSGTAPISIASTGVISITSPLPATNGGTGISNTATLTLGTSNQNWATLGTGIVKNTTTTGALSDAASTDVITLWTGTCSSSTFLRGDGSCQTPAGSGTITASPQYDIPYFSAAGTSSTITGLAWQTGFDGVPQQVIEVTSSGSQTLPTTSVPGVTVNAQSGATYTVLLTDRTKMVQTTNNTTSTAVTVPQAGSTGFTVSIPFVHCNTGTVVATDTPTTSTINGNVTVKLVGAVAGHNPECVFWWSDNTNYWGAEILPTDTNGKLAAEGFSSATLLPTGCSSSDVTGQSTSQSAVTLCTSALAAGQYFLRYYVDQSAVCTTGSNSVSFTFSWSDVSNARTSVTGSLSLGTAQSTNGYLTGSIPIYVSGSAAVTYTSTVSGSCATGTSNYDVHAKVTL